MIESSCYVALCVVCVSVPRPQATGVACIAGLRCVAAIFASLRCRRACWRLDANVPCGRASACSFAMLMLLCPASEKAALHSWPDNASLACLQALLVFRHPASQKTAIRVSIHPPSFISEVAKGGICIPHPSHEFPTWCLVLETAKVCTHNKKDGSSSSSHAKRMAQHY